MKKKERWGMHQMFHRNVSVFLFHVNVIEFILGMSLIENIIFYSRNYNLYILLN